MPNKAFLFGVNTVFVKLEDDDDDDDEEEEAGVVVVQAQGEVL